MGEYFPKKTTVQGNNGKPAWLRVYSETRLTFENDPHAPTHGLWNKNGFWGKTGEASQEHFFPVDEDPQEPHDSMVAHKDSQETHDSEAAPEDSQKTHDSVVAHKDSQETHDSEAAPEDSQKTHDSVVAHKDSQETHDSK